MKPHFFRFALAAVCSSLTVAYVHAGQDPNFAAKLASIEKAVEAKRKELKVPGACMVVVQDGIPLYVKGLGYRDQEKKIPATANTLFGIGSSTKAFTGLGMAMAVDEGLVQWTDHPKKYLPYFELWDKEANEKFTLTDLLCHRSGLNRTDILWIEDRLTREEAIRALRHVKPTIPFRAGFQYQNVMFAAAGEIVGKVFGKSWEQVTRERILLPLSMTSSNLTITELAKVEDRAIGYSLTEKGAEPTPYRHVVSCAPAGSINSNAIDMAKWLRFAMTGKIGVDRRIVSEAGYKEWLTIKTPVGPNSGYALGWFIRQWQGRKLVEHGGNIDGFNALVAFLPDDKIGFVMLTNVSNSELPSFAMETVFKTFLGDKKDPRQTEEPQGDPKKEVGTYASKDVPVKLTVELKDKKLRVTATGQPPLEIVNLGGRVYKFAPPAPDGIYLTFRPDSTDPSKTEVLLEQGGAKVVFTQESSDYKPDISVDELLRKMTDAMGGAKALQAAKSVVTHADVLIASQGLTGKATRYVSQGRFLDEVRFYAMGKNVASIVQVFDGKRGGANQFSRFVEIVGKPLEDLRREADLQSPLRAKADYSEIKIVGKEELDGEEVYLVQRVSKSGTETKEFVSARSFRVLKRESASGTERYYDFRKVDGLVIPFLSRFENPVLGSMMITVKEVKVNGKIDPKVFSFERVKAEATHIKSR